MGVCGEGDVWRWGWGWCGEEGIGGDGSKPPVATRYTVNGPMFLNFCMFRDIRPMSH